MINFNGLIFRLVIVILLAAITIGSAVSQYFYHIVYEQELNASEKAINQLHTTVVAAASIALYIQDNELINEVIAGLLTNNIVSGVAIKTEDTSSQSKYFENTTNTATYPIYSPFEKNRQVGELMITPDLTQIEQKAENISFNNQISIIIQTSIISLAVIIVAYYVITMPIIWVASSLHKQNPAANKHSKIPVPKYHDKSEIGELVSDINLLLDRNAKQFEAERSLRLQVEKLSDKLKLIFENANSAIILLDKKGDIVICNNAFLSLISKLNIAMQTNFGVFLNCPKNSH